MKDSHKKRIRILCNIGFLIYMIAIFYFVLFSERYGRQVGYQTSHYNLVLFKEIKRFIQYRELLTLESFVTNMIGNIFAFSPYGALIPIIREKKTGLFYVIFSTFCFSLSIELMQLAFKIGVFDVDDLLLNTVGGVIGYVCYRIVRKNYVS